MLVRKENKIIRRKNVRENKSNDILSSDILGSNKLVGALSLVDITPKNKNNYIIRAKFKYSQKISCTGWYKSNQDINNYFENEELHADCNDIIEILVKTDRYNKQNKHVIDSLYEDTTNPEFSYCKYIMYLNCSIENQGNSFVINETDGATVVLQISHFGDCVGSLINDRLTLKPGN